MRSLDLHFFRHASFGRAMLETGLVSLLIAGLFFLLRRPDKFSLTGLAIELGLLAPAYLALRTRFPQGGWAKQALTEGLRTLAISSLLLGLIALLVLAGGMSGSLLSLWVATGMGCFAVACGVHLALRGGLRVWFTSRALCRKRLALALTHAQLGLVVLTVLGATVIVALVGVADAVYVSRWQSTDLLLAIASALDKVVVANSLLLLLACPVFAVLLVVFGVFSFLFARRTTRRLEEMARAADALREKKYETRVRVDGEDEVARLQASFNHMASELTRALADLQAERDRVSGLLAERRELFAGVSHELRTPLAVLRSAQEALSARVDLAEDAELSRDLQIMDHQIARLQAELDDLFQLSQAEVARLALDCALVALDPLVGSVVEQFARLGWASSRVEVVFQAQDPALTVWADGGRLEQALLNLLRNGLQHTSPGDVIMVATERQGDCARIDVRDTGSGIDPTDLPHVWTRYFRADGQPTANPRMNAGLGLPLVKEFVEAMGGSVSAESRPGEGSCFSIFLPLV